MQKKGVMYYTRFYHEQVKASFPQPFLDKLFMIINQEIFHLLEKACSWSSLERSLSGTLNKKYFSETSGSQSLISHLTTEDTTHLYNCKATPMGDLKLRSLRDPLKTAYLWK